MTSTSAPTPAPSPSPSPTSQSAAVPEWIPYLSITLAALAFLVAAGGLLFTIIKTYRMEGGRVIVVFDPAIWDPGSLLIRQRSRDGSIRKLSPDDWMSSGNGERGVECAVVEIHNAGRVGVSVLEVGIQFKGRRLPRKFWKHAIGHVVPRVFRSRSFSVGTLDAPEKAIRLEPYSHALYLMDVHSVIKAAREARPRRPDGSPAPVELRASVRVAGRPRLARSRWRRRWRVPGQAVSLKDHSSKIAVESLIVLELAREFNTTPDPDSDNGRIEFISRLIAVGLWEGREISDVGQRVDAAFESDVRIRRFFEKEPAIFTLQYEIEQMLMRPPETLDWTGAERQASLNTKAGRRSAGEQEPASE